DSKKETFRRDLSLVAATLRRRPAAHAAPAAPIIHESVLRRIGVADERYAPIVIPQAFRVTTKAGVIQDPPGTPDQLERRASHQEAAWDVAWKRRVVYFLTVFASAFLVLLPFINARRPGLGQASPAEFLIPVVDLVGHVLPGFASFWLDAFKQAPDR